MQCVDISRLDATVLAEADTVINCTLGAPKSIRSTAERLFELAAKCPQPPRIVHLSSMTVYGAATGTVDESSSLREDLGDYGAAQIAAERCARAYPRSVILRPGCEYGPDCPQWSVRIARWLLARRIGDLGEDGLGICNLIHIDDLVAAIIAATTANEAEGQAFNVAMPSPPTWNEYFRRFAEALGAAPLRPMTPMRLLIETRILAPPLKIAEIIAGRFGPVPAWLPPAIPPSLPSLCRQRIELDSTKAGQILGVRWTPLDRGLQATAEHVRNGRGH